MNSITTSARIAALIMACAPMGGFAQHAGHQHGHHQMPAQDQEHAHNAHGHGAYAGFQNREIKALSPQQIEGLRAGRGISQALAAELNGYPGPMHVLELAEQLDLTADQHEKVQALYKSMKEQAVELGEELIAAEQDLDSMFKSRQITQSELDSQTQKIARIQGRLRAVHLGKHLETAQVLTPEQVESYNRLRGY